MKAETREVWVAEDGQVFDTKSACEAHETEILKRKQALANLKVWKVAHGFDSTEGRGYFAETLIVTDASEAALIQWCLDKFGAPLDEWYGDGFFESWHLHESKHDVTTALSAAGKRRWHNMSPTKLAVVSQKDWTWAELPKSEFPWPRKTKETRHD